MTLLLVQTTATEYELTGHLQTLYKDDITENTMINIRIATPADAPFIGEAITLAIGEELTRNLAGDSHTPEDVRNLFADLARRDDSQYSYLNTLVATESDGTVAGLIVSYDGADLRRLRRSFFTEAETAIGLKIEGEPNDETGPEEYYIDTLAVFPDFRGRGIACQLIEAAAERAKSIGKPTGLLVDKTNHRARGLYDRLGFRQVGERPFAGEMMDHLLLE